MMEMNKKSLFRAVMEEEFHQIQSENTFKNPEGIETKYFAKSEDHASYYARLAFGRFGDDSPYYIIEVEISNSLTYDSLIVDQEIETVVLTTDQLFGLVPQILKSCKWS